MFTFTPIKFPDTCSLPFIFTNTLSLIHMLYKGTLNRYNELVEGDLLFNDNSNANFIICKFIITGQSQGESLNLKLPVEIKHVTLKTSKSVSCNLSAPTRLNFLKLGVSSLSHFQRTMYFIFTPQGAVKVYDKDMRLFSFFEVLV